MARINTYDLDQVIRPEDLLVGSSLEGSFNGQPIYKTRNYRLDKMAEFFIGYDFNAGLSLTTLEGIVNQNTIDISNLDSSIEYLTLSSDSSIFMGINAGTNDDGTNNSNIGIGSSALNLNEGVNYNIAIGARALLLLTAGSGGNIAIGYSSLASLTSGRRNVSIGVESGRTLTTGYNNTIIGFNAGDGDIIGDDFTENNSSVLIGSGTRFGGSATANEIVIGYNVTGNGSNTFKAGSIDLGSFQFGELRNDISPLNDVRTVTWPDKDGTIAMIDDVPTTAEKDNWDAAYNDSVVGLSVTSNATGSVKTINLVRRSSLGLNASFTDIFESGAGGIVDTNNFVNSASFNTSTGVLTLDRVDLDSLTVNLDGRYADLTSAQTISGQKTFTTTSPKFDHYISLLEGAPAGSISGYGALTAQSGGILRFLPANEAFAGRLAFPGLTAQRTYTFPDASGTIALTSDLSAYSTVGHTHVTDDITNLSSYTGFDSRYLQSSSIDTISELQTLVADTTIWHSGNDGAGSTLDADLLDGLQVASSGDWWGVIPYTTPTGVTEVGKYVDFHNENAGVTDFDGRLTLNSTNDFTLSGKLSLPELAVTTASGITISGLSPKIQFAETDNSINWWIVADGNTFSVRNPSSAGIDKVFDIDSTGVVQINNIADVDSISFSPSIGPSNANEIMTWLPRDNSLATRLISGGSNWPASSGQFLAIRGSSDSGTNGQRTFSFWRSNNQNELYYGTLPADITTPTWTWNRLAHENTTNFSFKQDISFDSDVYLDTTSKIYFGFGTPQQEEVSAATISATTSAFNSVIVGGTTGSTITFTRLSSLAEDQYSITNIARLNSPNTFTGSLTAPDFILSSDVSLKENIKQYVASPIEINYKTYNLIGDEDKNQRVGVIAQELEQSHPEFVRQDENGVKSVSYIDLLMAKIAELEHRIKYLENGATNNRT